MLSAFSEWLRSKRTAGWLVIDVHGPMKLALEGRRKTEPAFTFAGDCVHPHAEGHWAIARAVIAGLGDADSAAAVAVPERLAAFLPDVTKRLDILRDATFLPAATSRSTASSRNRVA